MGSRAYKWLVNQYRHVLGRMRQRSTCWNTHGYRWRSAAWWGGGAHQRLVETLEHASCCR